MQTITLNPTEYTQLGGNQIAISLETILSKLPSQTALKIAKASFKTQQEAEKHYFDYFLLEKVDMQTLHSFLELNFEQNKSKKRALPVYVALLENLKRLRIKYGTYAFNKGLYKCDQPRKCTIAYMKAILKSDAEVEQAKADELHKRNLHTQEEMRQRQLKIKQEEEKKQAHEAQKEAAARRYFRSLTATDQQAVLARARVHPVYKILFKRDAEAAAANLLREEGKC